MHYFFALLAVVALPALAAGTEPVTVANFVRAETDTALRKGLLRTQGEFGKFIHIERPASAEQQQVIRTNRDTLYSGALLDLSRPVSITLPDAGVDLWRCM